LRSKAIRDPESQTSVFMDPGSPRGFAALRPG